MSEPKKPRSSHALADVKMKNINGVAMQSRNRTSMVVCSKVIINKIKLCLSKNSFE